MDSLSDKIKETNVIGKFLFTKHVKEFIQQIESDIDESADKTDIWDNERWKQFRRILIKTIKKRAGEDLI